jgi:hypothetical protein
MSQDDEAAREARAARLRAQIDRMTERRDDQPDASDDATADAGKEGGARDEQSRSKAGESPREFIHRKMRESGEGEKP